LEEREMDALWTTPTAWLIADVTDNDATSDAKSAKSEVRDEESERDADWMTPPMPWPIVEESERDATREAKSANSELSDEERDNDAL
jgi:hypothetical protein